VGFVVGKVALYFGLTFQFPFLRLFHTHHLSSGTGSIGHIVADVPSGRNLLQFCATEAKVVYDVKGTDASGKYASLTFLTMPKLIAKAVSTSFIPHVSLYTRVSHVAETYSCCAS
jgi:hypothetical protein